MLVLGMSILPTSVYAQGSAYTKGYKDALCDAVSCNGHGYKPSCPGDHSSEYCNNYRDGYAAGWDASTNANSNGQQHINPPPTQQYQSTPDWTLTVNVVRVPFGESTLNLEVRGPFGSHLYDSIPNSESPRYYIQYAR